MVLGVFGLGSDLGVGIYLHVERSGEPGLAGAEHAAGQWLALPGRKRPNGLECARGPPGNGSFEDRALPALRGAGRIRQMTK